MCSQNPQMVLMIQRKRKPSTIQVYTSFLFCIISICSSLEVQITCGYGTYIEVDILEFFIGNLRELVLSSLSHSEVSLKNIVCNRKCLCDIFFLI